MSSSRYPPRSGSPTGGRRFDNPGRSSTGSLGYSAYDGPPSSYSRHRDAVTSPRSSGERVIPISTERYVNGERVSASGSSAASRSGYDAYDSRPRRTNLDDPPRNAGPGSPSYSRTSVHQPEYRTRSNVGSSSGSSGYDAGSYISSNSSAPAPRREHKKIYSVDEDNKLRLQNEPSSRHGTVSSGSRDNRHSTDYHLSNPKQPQNLDDSDAYEYTDARGMYRDTEPIWRPRQHSFDGPRRDRPSSMVDSYPPADPRRSARELGPPPAMRGFDKINNSSNSGVSRHGSISNGQRSPTRHHHRRNSSDYYNGEYHSDQDEHYRTAPRISQADRGALLPYDPPDRRDPMHPPRDDRREPRHPTGRRFEDSEVASRGFGIRAPSADPPRTSRDNREPSLDRYTAYEPEPPRKALPAPREENYASEPVRGHERDPPRGKRDSPPRERDVVTRDRDSERERRDAEEPRRDREGSLRDRDHDRRDERRVEDGRRQSERRPQQDYSDEPRDRNHQQRDDSSSHGGPSVGGSLAGATLAGAAAYGMGKASDRYHHDDKASEREPREPAREHKEPREPSKQAVPGAAEPHPDDRARPPERDAGDRERGRFVDGSPDDMERPRRRHYHTARDSDDLDPTSTAGSRSSETLDPEEDYRRRVQQEANKSLAEDHSRDAPSASRRDGSDFDSDNGRESSMALTPYKSPSEESQESYEDEDGFHERRKRRVSIVEPAKAVVAPKSILRKPTAKFPEDPNPIREGIAPLKDAKNKDAPPTARWTKINRSMVNPEALVEAQERFEERQDHVIVLRVLTREEIQKFADRTKEIREGRYDKDHRRERRDKDEDHERDERRDREHDERDRHSDRERERHRHRPDRDREEKKEKTPELAEMLTGLVTNVLESSTKHR